MHRMCECTMYVNVPRVNILHVCGYTTYMCVCHMCEFTMSVNLQNVCEYIICM